jgi:NAD(P)-dependent dehydrogenase (short-subunit alcohol dehydrogenase family)
MPSSTTRFVEPVLTGKVCLVTGAGGSLGRAAALAFAGAGASVVISDVAPDPLEETAQLVKDIGQHVLPVVADVVDAAAVDALIKAALDSFGVLDCAFNNAGVPQAPGQTADIDQEEWERVIGINLTGIWLCMRAELRHMASRKVGAIVNTASVGGIRTLSGRSAYIASKHAVIGLTKNAAVEYATQGIRINAVCPGGVLTPLLEAGLRGLTPEKREESLKNYAQLHPMKRLGTPAEISDAVVFLCSDQSSFITGQSISVDGGWTAT